MRARSQPVGSSLTLDQARAWIGRRLVLRRSLFGLAPGTPCRVACVVDFGDEFLLWVETDDDGAREVDQLSLRDLLDLFDPLPAETDDCPGATRMIRII